MRHDENGENEPMPRWREWLNGDTESTDWKLRWDVAVMVIGLVVAAPWVGWALAALIGAGGLFALAIRAIHNRD